MKLRNRGWLESLFVSTFSQPKHARKGSSLGEVQLKKKDKDFGVKNWKGNEILGKFDIKQFDAPDLLTLGFGMTLLTPFYSLSMFLDI